ncbi:MAG: hypothetical protein HZC22_00610 [Rhodocyclales bacterium]|nr:hypothetical protein [Rhodocyclales bacterium]
MLNPATADVSTGALRDGYDDALLLRLSRLQHRADAGLAPWASWEAENSSFGKTLREWTGYPRWLPLCAVSDHGVHWESRCWPNEVDSPYRLFLSWNRKKCRIMREMHGKQALHIPHPWIAYRKAHHPNPAEVRAGTIVFFAHSNSMTTPVFESLEAYMRSLQDLPARFHPIVICLSFHDVLKGMHVKLRPFGFPIVTAGTTNAQSFVDRFYRLIGGFRYACSPTIGSHTYYLVEAGVPFFLHGSAPTYIIKGSRAVRDGEQDLRDYGDDEDIERFMALRRLFAEPVDAVTPVQRDTIATYLGLDAATPPELLAASLRRELLTNWPRVGGLYLDNASRLLRRCLRTSGK